MRIYRRVDGFEVQDAVGRGLDWVLANYGEGFTDVTADVEAAVEAEARAAEAEKPKQAIRAKLAALDAAVGPRPVREYLLSVGYKGAVKPGKTKGVIEEAEEDALSLRAQLALI